MFGLNLLALLLFLATHLFAVWLGKTQACLRQKTLRWICMGMLSFHSAHYLLPPLFGAHAGFPVEFSTIAYLVVPSILLFRRGRASSWAAYSGLMAGFLYYLTMILAGGAIYQSTPFPEVCVSLVSHAILYVCGITTVRTQKLPSQNGYPLLLGVAGVALYAHLMRPLVEHPESLLIYGLLDGRFFRAICPAAQIPRLLPVYYILMAGLLVCSVWGFFRLSRMQYQKYHAPSPAGRISASPKRSVAHAYAARIMKQK